MPESTEIRHVLVIGAGPVSAWPAARALREAGLRVTLADPNPARIVVDPDVVDAVYAAPVTAAGLARVIAAERPDGLLVALGGPAALDSALTLRTQGVLRRYGTTLLDVHPLTRQEIAPPTNQPCVDVETLSDRHGRVVVVGTVEHVGSAIVVPAQSATEDIERAAVTEVRAAGFGAGCCSVRFVADGPGYAWRIGGLTPGVSRASALVAATRGLPLAETVAMLAIGAEAPTLPPATGRVLVALDDGTFGLGMTFLAALNNALCATTEPWPDSQPPWLVTALRQLDELRARIEHAPVLDTDVLHEATLAGLGDDQIAALRPELADGTGVRRIRERLGLLPEPVALSNRDDHGRPQPVTDGRGPTVLLLGPSPGDPAAFHHACANGARALRRAGHRVAVLTAAAVDADYLTPPRVADVLGIVRAEQRTGPFAGVVAGLGGPRALAFGAELAAAGVDVIDLPEADVPAGPCDRPLRGAVAVEIVALYDGDELLLGAACESIDPYNETWPVSGCVLPAPSIGPRTLAELRRRTLDLARQHGLRGALSVRFAVLPDGVVARSVTSGASTHLATASAATGVELAQAAARLLLGASIQRLRAESLLPPTDPVQDSQVAVWLPPGVLGLGTSAGAAYAEARAAAGTALPNGGTVLVSAAEQDLRDIVPPARELAAIGFHVLADPTTATTLRRNDVDCTAVHGEQAADLVIDTHHTAPATASLAAQAITAQRMAEPGTPPVRIARWHHPADQPSTSESNAESLS